MALFYNTWHRQICKAVIGCGIKFVRILSNRLPEEEAAGRSRRRRTAFAVSFESGRDLLKFGEQLSTERI